MKTLALKARSTGEKQLSVHIHLGGEDVDLKADCTFPFEWTAHNQEDLRWYLEDYPAYVTEPAPQIAARIEQDLAEFGRTFFRHLFLESANSQDLWATAKPSLGQMRVEVVTDLACSTIPWELLRDVATDVPLALSAGAFVRQHINPAHPPTAPSTETPELRILLVICRPGGSDDVPFRSVASRLLRAIGPSAGGDLRLDVLRPPTFEQLGRVLQKAQNAGKQYQIVHFDGHGADRQLIFENPALTDNAHPVDGSSLGHLLAATGVPILILNACRSAHAYPVVQPLSTSDVHEDIRNFGSLSHEILDQGVAGVVSMRLNVFVDTAAEFVRELYSSLLQGVALGTAVSSARKQLHLQPLRKIGLEPVPLQDWLVPVVFEHQPLELFPRREKKLKFSAASGTSYLSKIDAKLPARPDAGFFGRDETLLALDRAFDEHSIVLLHAFAGSGKTATAAEFARWYSLTHGVEGPVLFTSFQSHRTLQQVIEQLARQFESVLQNAGILWAAIDEDSRIQTAIELLQQQPVFWIWDNVETVTGFPSGTPSDWLDGEQKDLAEFLRSAAGTACKFLLTSRREETDWLAELPTRVRMPQMAYYERLQLAAALVSKRQTSLVLAADLRSLLIFTQGNPLTINVLVTQVLRDALTTTKEISDFVERLEAGTAAIDDEVAEGRSRSLKAALTYGMEHAFDVSEQKIIALLHLFQAFVRVEAYELMGTLKEEYRISDVAELKDGQLGDILDRAAESGMLEKFSDGMYRIHPAVPWFLRLAFLQHFKGREDHAIRAFTIVHSGMSSILSQSYQYADSKSLELLLLDEANIRRAWKLARDREMWKFLRFAMHGLEDLYRFQGRITEWKRLVDETAAIVEDPKTGLARPGTDDTWAAVMEYKLRIAKGNPSEEERFARLLVDHHRTRATPYLDGTKPLSEGYEEIHNFAVMLDALGDALIGQKKKEGLQHLDEALDLCKKINDRLQAAVVYEHMGWASRGVEELKGYEEALRYFVEAVNTAPPEHHAFRGKCLFQIGNTLLRMAAIAENDGDSEKDAAFSNQAIKSYRAALNLLPEHAVQDRSLAWNSLGAVFMAWHMWSEAEAAIKEVLQTTSEVDLPREYSVGLFNMASILYETNRYHDAMTYAKAALVKMEKVGDSDGVVKCLQLIAEIKGKQQTN